MSPKRNAKTYPKLRQNSVTTYWIWYISNYLYVKKCVQRESKDSTRKLEEEWDF